MAESDSGWDKQNIYKSKSQPISDFDAVGPVPIDGGDEWWKARRVLTRKNIHIQIICLIDSSQLDRRIHTATALIDTPVGCTTTNLTVSKCLLSLSV